MTNKLLETRIAFNEGARTVLGSWATREVGPRVEAVAGFLTRGAIVIPSFSVGRMLLEPRNTLDESVTAGLSVFVAYAAMGIVKATAGKAISPQHMRFNQYVHLLGEKNVTQGRYHDITMQNTEREEQQRMRELRHSTHYLLL